MNSRPKTEGGQRAKVERAASGTEIDQACERFENACRVGARPSIEESLAGWEEPERSKLLGELLLLELRHSLDVDVDIAARRDDYLRRFPEHGPLIVDVFERLVETVALETSTSGLETQVNQSDETLTMESRFHHFRPHAQGGLGIVFRASDSRLGRDVAVKFIRADMTGRVESREQFQLEAEITSRLEHPGVVPVYGLGVAEDERPFYAMRFVEGETLDEALRRYHASRRNHGSSYDADRRELKELLARFVDVCQTLAYAHNRGVIHRDVKPENVMLGRYGETLVIDWGLALPIDRVGVFKQSGEPSLRPASGSHGSRGQGGPAGTPAYMSPEQATGDVPLTPATDIYSLGATLYKILVGRAPFRGGAAQVRADVRAGNFEHPRAVDRQVPRALDAICVRAMQHDPSQRYATASELARDVEDYMADAPVSAYREPWSVRCARWARRNRVLSQSILIGFMVLAVGGGITAITLRSLQLAALQSRHSEREQRRQGLMTAARFAARTIANNVDIRLRILEHTAAKPELRRLLNERQADDLEPDPMSPLQQWLDGEAARYREVEAQAWFLCAANGVQIARHPSHGADGKIATSYGQNFSYRDYFHGKGMDFLGSQAAERPLSEPHISVALESTNESQLMISFSVPVRNEADTETIAVLGMSVALGKFADLKIPLSSGQSAMLVDTRSYILQRSNSEKETGQGLVLQHPSLGDPRERATLPRLAESCVRQLKRTRPVPASDGEAPVEDHLLTDDYRDPLAAPEDGPWLAAFAPVVLTCRPKSSQVHDTGCFVIVQQVDR